MHAAPHRAPTLPDWGDMAETSKALGMPGSPRGGSSRGVTGKGTPGTHRPTALGGDRQESVGAGSGCEHPCITASPGPGQVMGAGTLWAPTGSMHRWGRRSILHPWQGRAVLGNPSPGLAEQLAGGKGGLLVPPCGSGGGGGLISSADAILG